MTATTTVEYHAHAERAARIVAAIDLPNSLRAGAAAVVAGVMAGEDTRDLAEALLAVYLQAGGSHQPQRPDLVAHVLDWPAGPIVYGDALSTCYRDGRTRSLLSARHGKSRVLRWFKGAAPDTLMEEKERAAFAALPDLVTAS